ncbi:MAG: sulfite exporter TauE/SafE family protein [Candidatus Aenigmatarchaeota archaeon]
MFPELMFSIIIIAFILEFFDASLGMGYGTTLAPLLLLMGFAPLEAIPTVLLTNAVIGPVAGFFHHRFENVDLRFKSKYFKTTLVLTVFGALGILIATLIAVELPENILKAYIGLLVLTVGIFVLVRHKKKRPFSWKKITGLGSLAAFNKGMTGGGYGSVIVGGQIIAGIDGKKAVGIASVAEGLICIIGVLGYLSINTLVHLNWSLIVSLLIGALASIPLAAYVVRKFHPKKLKIAIGIFSIILGTAILTKLFL